MKKIRVGLIGVGGISSQHISEMLECPDAEIVAICDISEKAIEEKNARLGLPKEKCYTDYHDLLADPDIDAVEIMTPNRLHARMAIDALEAGKHVNLEKPVSLNYKEALGIVEAQKRCKKQVMTCFSYRFKGAVRYAKSLIDSGALGEIVGVNVSYLKDSAFWQGRRLEWRFVKAEAGSGVLGDLGVHLIDLAQLLCGSITDISAMQKTVVKERPMLDSDELGRVETDDMCGFLALFECGAHGSFHITRCAIGNKNTIKYDVYGTRGSISFNLNNPEVLDVCVGEGDPRDYEFKTLDVPKEFFTTQAQVFIDSINGKTDALYPTISDGAQGQLVIDCLLKSAEERRFVKVEG